MRGAELVVIGASWGGLHAIGTVVGGLPGDFAVPVVVVQHRGPDAGDLLGALLDRQGPLGVTEAEDKAPLRPGCVRVAPAGYHVLVERGHLALSPRNR